MVLMDRDCTSDNPEGRAVTIDLLEESQQLEECNITEYLKIKELERVSKITMLSE